MCDVSEESMAQTKAICERAAPRGTRVTTTIADVSDEPQVIAFRDAVAREHAPITSISCSTTLASARRQLHPRRTRRVGEDVRRVLVRRVLLLARVRADADRGAEATSSTRAA
jgi:hypothetical protein